MIMSLAPSDWIAVAQVAGGIAMLLVLKPIADLKRELFSLRTSLYEEFVTYERLNEKFADRDEARDRQNKVRTARASRRQNITRKSA